MTTCHLLICQDLVIFLGGHKLLVPVSSRYKYSIGHNQCYTLLLIKLSQIEDQILWTVTVVIALFISVYSSTVVSPKPRQTWNYLKHCFMAAVDATLLVPTIVWIHWVASAVSLTIKEICVNFWEITLSSVTWSAMCSWQRWTRWVQQKQRRCMFPSRYRWPKEGAINSINLSPLNPLSLPARQHG